MLIPIILSGGYGERLWPVSRQKLAKPFVKVQGKNSLLYNTLTRAAAIPNVKQIVTLTNQDYYYQTVKEYQKFPQAIDHHYILEPCKRNTAPAITMATKYVAKTWGKDVSMLILPADHIIEDHQQFFTVVSRASALAQSSYLVTIGIQPDQSSSEYGYIHRGEAIEFTDDDTLAYHAQKFVEKPSASLAQDYLDSGEYLWNSGIFCFTPATYLNNLNSLASDICQTAEECWPDTLALNTPVKISAAHFSKMPDISIDYAVMEKSDKVAVVTADFPWSDLGNWDAITKLNQLPNKGLQPICIDTDNCYIHPSKRQIATIGLQDTIIVDTDDALLIVAKNRSAEVKQVVAQLKTSGSNTVSDHITVYRPWGSYTVLEEGRCFKVKCIVVYPGASLSLQMHKQRSEHWVVVDGTAQVTNGDESLELQVNQSTYIPAGHKHRLSNAGTQDLSIIEIQTGKYLGEDDIVRFDDIYGR